MLMCDGSAVIEVIADELGFLLVLTPLSGVES